MFKIDTMKGHERMSTQDLLLAIGEAVKQGETDFEIKASGQHDIGGPLWHPEGKKLHFHVWNAGQRTGSMCLPGTEIVIEESTTPAASSPSRAMPAIRPATARRAARSSSAAAAARARAL